MSELDALSAATPTDHRRSSRQPRQRYLDNSLTGNEVFDLLDEFITEDSGAAKRKPRKRRKKTPHTTVDTLKDPVISKPLGRPRWYNQMYLMFLALRQSPGYTASRSELVRKAVELDRRISEERGLPRAFTGKTPQNSASALLTNNGDKHFVQFRPAGARCFHFRLAYKPGDFEGALVAYNEWMEVLVGRDWPLCFGPEQDSNAEQMAVQQQQPTGDIVSARASDIPSESAAEQAPVNSMQNGASENTLAGDVPEPPAFNHAAKKDTNNQTDHKPGSEPPIPPVNSSSDTCLLVAEYNIPKTWQDIVEVKPSTIPNAGNGLFAVRDLPAGIPLGFYFGVPMTEDEFDSLKENIGLSSHYSIMYRRTVLDATDDNGQPYTDPNGPLYCPFHFMNEDREGKKCNIVFLEGVKVNQIICLTNRKIRSGEELFVSYGTEVDRSHWDHTKDNKQWGMRVSSNGNEQTGIAKMLETLTTTGVDGSNESNDNDKSICCGGNLYEADDKMNG
ncbi:hypothetical protein GGF40_003571 [Coemansia sp. RSA 1286]|nr:hypothetical protein GGF40_003571 [Coemansia sp. RSA 1286]